MKYWDELTLKEIQGLQDKLLTAFIRSQVYPYHEHYRSRFDRYGIRPDDIRSIADLKRFPELLTWKYQVQEDPRAFILRPTPELVRRYAPFSKKLTLALHGFLAAARTGNDTRRRRDARLACRPGDEGALNREAFAREGACARFQRYMNEAMRSRLEQEYKPVLVTATTGRSTAPLPFLYTHFDRAALLQQLGLRFFEMLDMEEMAVHENGAIEITSMGTGVDLFPTVPHLAYALVEEGGFGATNLVTHTGGGKGLGTLRSINVIAAQPYFPVVIFGVPSYVTRLLRVAAEQGKDFSKVTRVVLGGDRVTELQRKRIIEYLKSMGSHDPVVLATYAFTETRAAFMECLEGAREGMPAGYHVFPDLTVVETLRGVSEPNALDFRVRGCKDGEVGAIAATPLTGRGSVVIRYLPGDFGATTSEPCPPCGRYGQRILPDIFRLTSDMEKNVKGTRVNFNDVRLLFGEHAAVVEWQIVLQYRRDLPEEGEEIICYVALDPAVPSDPVLEELSLEFQSLTEVSLDRIILESYSELVARLKLDEEMKEERIIDRRS